jgi:alkaline phosphatase D
MDITGVDYSGEGLPSLGRGVAGVQAVHAAFPWIVTWDDHETENDYAGFIPENLNDPADLKPDFASRRARAYQVYYEHMPIRAAQSPVGPSLQLFRRVQFGEMLSVHVLDTRQYRSHRAPATCMLSERIDSRLRPTTPIRTRRSAPSAARSGTATRSTAKKYST